MSLLLAHASIFACGSMWNSWQIGCVEFVRRFVELPRYAAANLGAWVLPEPTPQFWDDRLKPLKLKSPTQWRGFDSFGAHSTSHREVLPRRRRISNLARSVARSIYSCNRQSM